MKRKKRTPKPIINAELLAIKQPPASLKQAEAVTERLLGKKLKPKQKESVKFKAAIRNYRKAVTRYRLAVTLLEKHEKVLAKLKGKHL